MNPIYLEIKDFMCYGSAKLDFTKFESALIIGKINNNLDISNGAGKSSIFNAIEYCLFNDFGDIKLDRIVRDGQKSCSVEYCFELQNLFYKILRSRSAKGTSSVQVFESVDLNSWKDISGRRNSDTEDQIKKIIKINPKSFRNSTHFVQHDFSGITNSKPQERKNTLKQVFDLSIYTKLEKIAKEKLSNLNKENIKYSTLLESNGNPNLEKENSLQKLKLLKQSFNNINSNRKNMSSELQELINKKINLENSIKQKSDNLPLLLAKEKQLKNYISLLETDINKLISNKNSSINKLNSLKIDLSKINPIDNELEQKLNKEKELFFRLSNKFNLETKNLEDLKIKAKQFQSASHIDECETCFQVVSSDHSEILKNKIDTVNQSITQLESLLADLNVKIKESQLKQKELANSLNKQNADIKNTYTINNDINLINSNIENINNIISIKRKEFSNLTIELESIKSELDKKSLESVEELKIELNNINNLILIKEKELLDIQNKLELIKKDINILDNIVLQLEEKIKLNIEYSNKLKELENDLAIYPLIVEAFSSTGIPSFIINNLLNDVQEKANLFCNKIKPGLQIQFVLVKENSSGDEVDTLDIKYFYNGQEREYAQLSGAMKFNATFSIKLALSIIIQEILGVDIKFFLFDEIDSSLDKFSSNEFVNVIKELQKDYKILLITHGDSLKDKFNNKIIVEQNSNGYSTIIQN